MNDPQPCSSSSPTSTTTPALAGHDAVGRQPLGAGPDRWPRPLSRPRRTPATTSPATVTDMPAAHPASVTAVGRDPRSPGRVWAYLGIVVGAVVSVAANVAHSFVPPPDWPGHPTQPWRPEPGAVLGAMFWPVALLITTEIMTRTPWPPGRAWLLLRFAGLLPVAAVAAVVSYLHLHGLLQHYHEAPLTCVIAPFSVDGLMVMASSALAAAGRPPDDRRTRSAKATVDTAAAMPPTAPGEGQRDARDIRPATAHAVARLSAESPHLSTTDIATRLGVSTRTVRRHLATQRGTTPAR